jgi:hypothetical protein
MKLVSYLREQVTPLVLGLTILSGLLWIALWYVNMELAGFTQYTAGINLIYLPAGYRLLIILVFGFWGALGIFLFSPLTFLSTFGTASISEILVNAAIGAFVPYACVAAFRKVTGLSAELTNLRAQHLPLLALAVSIATPLCYNVQFLLAGREVWENLPGSFLAMALGDFLGSFLLLLLAFAAIRFMRLFVLRREQ